MPPRVLRFLVPILLAACGALAGQAQDAADLFRIELDPIQPVRLATQPRQGKPVLFVTVPFRILRTADGQPVTDVTADELVVEEDRRPVQDLHVFQPRGRDRLTVILALDISGSMARQGKMDAARRAAQQFLDSLHESADCGLILFDHELRQTEPPSSNRAKLKTRLSEAQPGGGTAYLDAAARALELLRDVPGRKAVLLMTDGLDLHSKQTLEQVMLQAQAAQVPIYTLGVGEPGRKEPVSTVLVLDRSGSMKGPAGPGAAGAKIDALKRAAGQFIDRMRPGARTTLLPFSTTVDNPLPFTDDKSALKQNIARLKPEGETALFDAACTAIETLEAARPVGKRAVVVLTDGIDSNSRHRPEDVIERARETGTAVHMLGLGRPGELDENQMRHLAHESRGEYHHAPSEAALVQIFESLAFQLYDDGIDEAALRQLAEKTGGKYLPARDVARLPLVYHEVVEELQTTYTVTFASQRSTHDGTARGIDISIRHGGARVSEVARLDYQVPGVVVPQMDAGVYLGLLAVLGALLALPAGWRRLFTAGPPHGR